MKGFIDKEVSSNEPVRSAHTKVDELLTEIERASKNHSLPELPPILATVNFLRHVYALSVDLSDLVWLGSHSGA